MHKKKIKRYPYFSGKQYKTYDFTELSDVPQFIPAGSGKHRVVITGSMHDKKGRLSKESPEAKEVLYHLRAKIEENVDDIALYEKNYQRSAKTCVISFLATDLACREAVAEARKNGIAINHLTLFTLFPVPKNVILGATKGCTSVLVPEENLSGQYLGVIRYLFQGKNILKINRIGALISPAEVLAAINAASPYPSPRENGGSEE